MDTDLDVATEDPIVGDCQGYVGRQLFKCLKCDKGFDNSYIFRTHVGKCIEPQARGVRAYRCYHCNKDLKSVHSLTEHIKVHGSVRYGCSLCDFKHASSLRVRNHMKSRHSVCGITIMPVDPKKNDPDRDEFIMRPKLKRKSTGDSNVSSTVVREEDDCKLELTKMSYSPAEMNLLPRQPIYSLEVRCSICNYSTKVRTNLVRHLEFHSMEKEVPTSAPVNPVPCLEKNEKMFDKMTNLALSSFANVTREKSDKLSKEAEAQFPCFVPTTKRYVCGATGCNYLCLEESLLKHHLNALHADESSYTCKHCDQSLCTDKTVNVDLVMKHLKLHDLHLYKCPSCEFVHNLKHKAERHLAEKHPETTAQVVVVREMDCEPEVPAQTHVAQPAEIAPTALRPWHCCMCKGRASTREEIVMHAENRHDIGEQYKCPLCTYKDSTKDNFTAHYAEKHPGHDVDVITVFCNIEEAEKSKAKGESVNFDTTPLWQRDRQRVRHIRGILFEESAKMPKKPPAKQMDNLDRSIEAVVNGEDKNKDIEDEEELVVVDDEEEEEEKKEEVVGVFGPFGEPFNNKYLCPLCAKFKTKLKMVLRCHLYQELQYYR